LDIRGLSLAARAAVVREPGELEDIARLRLQRHPEYAALPLALLREAPSQRISPQAGPHGVAVLRIAPEIISVLDCSKGFGHSDLVTFSERGFDAHIGPQRHRWDGADEALSQSADVRADDAASRPDQSRPTRSR
jgi:hypothetical protein